MAHVVAPNLRGKCASETKFTKSGEPKRSGNWSYQKVHQMNLQSRDYRVCEVVFESGIKCLIVGDNTPLAQLMGEIVATLAMNDEHFDSYTRKGYKTVGVKKYEAKMVLTKANCLYSYMNYKFLYREMIYTDGDFNYNFPEY